MKREKISAVVWLAVSVAIMAGSLRYSYGTWSHPGPAFLPFWCGLIMAFLSAVVLAQTFWAAGKKKGPGGEPFLTSRWSKLIVVLGILFGYAFLLDYLGFIMITFLAMLFLLKIVELTRWRTALLEAVLATSACYVVFELWLKVPLPKGFLPSMF